LKLVCNCYAVDVFGSPSFSPSFFLSFSLSFLLLFPFFSLSFFPSLGAIEQQQEEKTQSSCRTAQVTLQSLEGAFNKAVVAVTPPADKATNYKYLAASNVLK
jgi:hypothetical protein